MENLPKEFLDRLRAGQHDEMEEDYYEYEMDEGGEGYVDGDGEEDKSEPLGIAERERQRSNSLSESKASVFDFQPSSVRNPELERPNSSLSIQLTRSPVHTPSSVTSTSSLIINLSEIRSKRDRYQQLLQSSQLNASQNTIGNTKAIVNSSNHGDAALADSANETEGKNDNKLAFLVEALNDGIAGRVDDDILPPGKRFRRHSIAY
jgi:hypothetical protein